MPKKITEEPSYELSSYPTKQYEKFFSLFKEIETIPITSWKIQHILGYFAKLFKSHYALDYTFDMKPKSPVSMPEVFFIKKISQMLSAKPEIFKDYIDWIFKEKIKERKKRITSIGYLATIDLINEYKFKFLFNKKIERSSMLPNQMIDIIKKYPFPISTYGELCFLRMSLSSNPTQELIELFEEINKDFNLSMLDNLK